MKIRKWIDPPSGWKYGFPKEIPEDITDINKWLEENGYPKSEIDYWVNGKMGYIPCGIITEKL